MYLNKISSALNNVNNKDMNYKIPSLWNFSDYQNYQLIDSNTICVNPYEFYNHCISEILKISENKNYLQSLSKMNNLHSNGDWIKNSTVYSTMIRTQTTFDHGHNFQSTGTFLKMIAYLPTLKYLGVDTIYMLPISKYSRKDRKGELGSVYGVTSFLTIDFGLKDDLLSTTVEEEFKAFIEAAHILNIRVMIDIIPRTNSVNSDLILKHPEWFYWIKNEDLEAYKPPYVPGVEATTVPNNKNIELVYSSQDVIKHINKFVKNPKDANLALWNQMISTYDESMEPIDFVRSAFNLSVAPAFSDHINDVQPAWSDVTFFRLYMDHPAYSKMFLFEEKNPYILFDTIKGNLFPGEVPNMELWNLLSNVIPYFQKEFGIDGARIDMGHALPIELVQMIIKKAKEVDEDFCFIAEEMNLKNADNAKKSGYNMIIGDAFISEARVDENKLREFVKDVFDLSTPVFACAETHDTPRIAARYGKEKLANSITLLNLFIPNAVSFINSGQEFFEVQPMNLGIDCVNDDLYNLHEFDKYFGKLALFDEYGLHFYHSHLINEIHHLNNFKKYYQDVFKKENASLLDWDLIAIEYKKDDLMFLVLFNDHTYKNSEINLDSNYEVTPIFTTFGSTSFSNNFVMNPLDFVFLKLRKRF